MREACSKAKPDIGHPVIYIVNRARPRQKRLITRILPRAERNRLVIVGVAALVLSWLLVQSWDALAPFIVALVLAYILMPLVELLARVLPRLLAVFLIYLLLICAVWAAVAWLAPLATGQVRQLADQIPVYSRQIQHWSTDVAQWYDSLPLSAEVRQLIESSGRNSLDAISSSIQEGVVGAAKAMAQAVGFVAGLVIIPFWLFYVLKDKDPGISAFNRMLPQAWRADAWRIVGIVNGVLGSYLRAQLMLALVVGLATTAGMIMVGAPYPLLLGIISGLAEAVPIVGPVFGAVPGLLVAAVSGDWVLILKVLAVYLVVQQLENYLLVPKIQGDSVKMHPAIIMVALVVGSQLAGLLGLVVAVPVAAVLRDVYLYLYRRFCKEPVAGEAPRKEGSKGGRVTAVDLVAARE